MKKKSKVIALLLTMAMTVSLFAGCGNKESGEGSGSGDASLAAEQVFRYAKSSDTTGLNPIVCTSAPDNEVSAIIYEGLVRNVADKNDEAVQVAGAAETWDIDKDGCTYTFHIRENAVWSDGVPVTANDFEYTLKLMADPTSGATAGWLYDGVIVNFGEALYSNGATPDEIGVKALDEKTLEIKLTKPCSYFLELISNAFPVRQDVYEEYGQSYGASVDKIMTNGAFKLVKWEPNVQLTYEKSETYWNAENVTLAGLEAKIISDTATAAQALLNGDIDVLSTSDAEWKAHLQATEGLVYNMYAQSNPEFFTFNCANKYFKNPKIRLAFSLAIDREKFNQDLRNGEAEVMYGMMPGVIKVADQLYSELVDSEMVKTLMGEYPDPKALLIEGLKEEGLDPDPAKMEVKLATRGTEEFSKKMAEWMLQMWEETLGVTITIDMMEWNVMWDMVDAGTYDIATSGWGPYYNDPYGLLSIYDPESGYFDKTKTGWTDADSEKFHELLVQSDQTADTEERAQLLFEAEKLLVGTGVIAPTYTGTNSCFVKDSVQGYHMNPCTYTDYTLISITE